MKLKFPPKGARFVAALGIASLTLLAAGAPDATAKKAPQAPAKSIAAPNPTRSVDLKQDVPGGAFNSLWDQFERQTASKRADGAAPELFVKFSAMTGAPRLIYGDMGLAPSAGKAGDRARLFLEANAHMLGLETRDLVTERAIGGVVKPSHTYFQQKYEGLPVFYSGAGVHMDLDGRVWAVNNTYVPVSAKSTTPSLAAESALDASLVAVNADRGSMLADHTSAPELGIWPTADGGRLVWRTTVSVRDRGGWEVVVDAHTGELVEPPVSTVCNADGQGTIFQPNAVVTTANDLLRDNTSPFPEAAYTAVTLPNLNASPNTNVVGSWAQVHPSHSNKVSRADLNFSDLRRNTTPASAQFNQVNVYWGIDFAHSVFEALGFGAASDSPVMNYSIQFYAHNSPDVGSGGNVDNSHFSQNGDAGGTGHVCFGTGGVDDGEDQEIIWHEYGHAVLEHQRPPMNQNVTGEGMGEGFGDYLAGTMSKRLPGGQSYYVTVGEWDAVSYNAGGTPHPFLRKLDNPTLWANRPSSGVHAPGEVWSHPLFDFDNQVGPDVALTVILEGNFLLDNSPTQAEGGVAMVTASQMLWGGATTPFVQNAFRERGTIAGAVVPVVHTIGVKSAGTNDYFLRNSNTPGNANVQVIYGAATWTPLMGDWDGNGSDTIGAYDPTSGTFFLRNSNTPGNADMTIVFGVGGANYRPIAGDWDGNGTETIGLYDINSGTFFLKNSNTPGPADVTVVFGVGGATIKPIVGDWDGNGSDTIGIYDTSSATFFLKNSNAPGNADITFIFGSPNAQIVPIAGDWNADNVNSVGIYDPATGTFFIKNTNSAGLADYSAIFGAPLATPIVGDWNGGMH
jgi:hypothetical protein